MNKSLKEITLLDRYATNRNNLAADFYSPCLEHSVKYDRAVGFFRSSVFLISNVSIISFAKRGGKIRLICSPQMTNDDVEAIKNGYDLREKIGELLIQEILFALEDKFCKSAIELLATLVAINCLEIRIAFCINSNGIFHDKIGTFTDIYGDSISFTGSINETYTGWDVNGNHESFDVFRSWTADNQRVILHQSFFNSLWDDFEPGIQTIPFPLASHSKLISCANPDGVEAAFDKVQSQLLNPRKTLFPHQSQALIAWEKNGNRGILQHATGSGKTITAIYGVKKFILLGQPILIIVPSELLLDQWYKEIRTEHKEGGLKILLVGAGHVEWKTASVVEAFSSREGGQRIILATIQSACSDDFLARINGGEHLVIVIDEVHRAGSHTYSKVFTINSGARLGLSATPQRYGDSDGTKKIMEYFNGIIEPPFTLGDAIKAGRLCKYTYHIHEISLNHAEFNQWSNITEKIKKAYARSIKDENGKILIGKYLKTLLIKRAGIIKQAEAKIEQAVEIIKENFTHGDRWLIYCDSQKQLDKVREELTKAGYENDEYISEMIGDKKATLDYFTNIGGILVAIKCLDEGIDIPLIDHVLILASSKNPREFIQRRGRVLRKAPGKYFSEIHDIIVIPEKVKDGSECSTYVRTELSRAIQFSEMAYNNSAKIRLKSLASEFNLNPDDLLQEIEGEAVEEDYE